MKYLILSILLLLLICGVNAESITFRADINCNGYVGNTKDNTSWWNSRMYIGDMMDNSTIAISVQTGTIINHIKTFNRGIVCFNISNNTLFPKTAIVRTAEIVFVGYSKSNQLGSVDLGITGFNPTSDGSMTIHDYDNFYNDRWNERDITYNAFHTNPVYNNRLRLNDLGISNLSTHNMLYVMLRTSDDIDGSFTGTSIVPLNTTQFLIRSSSYSSGIFSPELQISFSNPVTPTLSVDEKLSRKMNDMEVFIIGSTLVIGSVVIVTYAVREFFGSK